MKNRVYTILSVLCVILNSQSQVSFTTAGSYNVGIIPQSMTKGDFNGDGNTDLATANKGADNISVLLGNGIGGFSSIINYSVVSNPQSITTGDFNSDGDADLAVANFGTNDISILLGSGTGNFAAAVNYPSVTNPFSIITSDFNSDGNADLATTNYITNNISILFGNGAGSFGAPTNYAVGTNPIDLVSTDFNSDGKLDIAVTNNNSNSVSVLLGSSTGTFAAAVNYTVGSNPFCLTISDFNADGKADLAVANNNSNNISILLGNGLGAFAPSVNYIVGTSPRSITKADFNNDGSIDLAICNTGSSNISVLLGNGSGAFASAINFTIATAPYFLTVADYNGDGKVDIASTIFKNVGPVTNVTILLNITNTCPSSVLSISSQTNISCNGNNNGAASILATGGSGYTYTWSPSGGNASTAVGLSAGVYSCAVTNSCGTIATKTVLITQPTPLVLTAIANNITTCLGNTNTLTANGSGGSGAITYTWVSGPTNNVYVVSPIALTIYTVNISDANGCVKSQTLAVNVKAKPTVLATTNSSIICVGQTATLTASGANTYTWNNSANTSATAVSPTITTTYTVTGTDASGCSNTAIITQNVSLCIGLQTLLENQNSIIVFYPNPSNGLFTIELTANAKIIITNVLGQEFINNTFEAGNHIMSLNNISSGTYFLKVITANNQTTKRLLISR